MLQLNQKINVSQNITHSNIISVCLPQDNQTKTPGKMYRMRKAGWKKDKGMEGKRLNSCKK